MARKALFITLEYPPTKGGVASYYHGVVGELERQGYEVAVWSQALLTWWVWPHWLPLLWKISKRFKKESFDILLVGHILPLGTVAWVLRRFQKIPYLVFCHGMDVLMAKSHYRKRWIARGILKSAKAVIANVVFTKKIVLSFGIPSEKVKVLYPCPNTFPTPSIEQVEQISRQWSLAGKHIILSVSRLVRRKGLDTMLSALPEVLKSDPHALYIMVGDGPDRNFLMQKIYDLKLQGSVRMVGAIDQETLAALYTLAHVFVMPSRQIGTSDVEGFGIVFLEAAQFGLPSIGGRSGGSAEAIIEGQTGLLVDPNDSVALAKTVSQVLQDEPLRTHLGQSAKARVEEEFKWEKQIAPLRKLL